MRKKHIVIISSAATVVVLALAILVIILLRNREPPNPFKQQFIAFILENTKVWESDYPWGGGNQQKQGERIAKLYDFLNGQNIEAEWSINQKNQWADPIIYFIDIYLSNLHIDNASLQKTLGYVSWGGNNLWDAFQTVDQNKLRAQIFVDYPDIKQFFPNQSSM